MPTCKVPQHTAVRLAVGGGVRGRLNGMWATVRTTTGLQQLSAAAIKQIVLAEQVGDLLGQVDGEAEVLRDVYASRGDHHGGVAGTGQTQRRPPTS